MCCVCEYHVIYHITEHSNCNVIVNLTHPCILRVEEIIDDAIFSIFISLLSNSFVTNLFYSAFSNFYHLNTYIYIYTTHTHTHHRYPSASPFYMLYTF